jgi:hypothetical protein
MGDFMLLVGGRTREKRGSVYTYVVGLGTLQPAATRLRVDSASYRGLVPKEFFSRRRRDVQKGGLDMRKSLKNLEIIAEKISQDSRETTNLTPSM